MKFIKGDVFTYILGPQLYYLRVTAVDMVYGRTKIRFDAFKNKKMEELLTFVTYTREEMDAYISNGSMTFIRHNIPNWEQRIGGD